MRTMKFFGADDDYARLDAEVFRRKSAGEDKGEDGQRIQVNRSLVLRDLIRKHLPKGA